MRATLATIEAVYRTRCAGFTAALTGVAGSRDAAADSVQEGFAIAVRERRTFQGGSLDAWVWKITLRAALRGRSRAELPTDVDELDVGLPDERRDPDLAAAIRTLPPRRRLVVFLRYFADLSYTEIAAALDVSEGTVGASLAQAHHALHTELEKDEVRP